MGRLYNGITPPSHSVEKGGDSAFDSRSVHIKKCLIII